MAKPLLVENGPLVITVTGMDHGARRLCSIERLEKGYTTQPPQIQIPSNIALNNHK